MTRARPTGLDVCNLGTRLCVSIPTTNLLEAVTMNSRCILSDSHQSSCLEILNLDDKHWLQRIPGEGQGLSGRAPLSFSPQPSRTPPHPLDNALRIPNQSLSRIKSGPGGEEKGPLLFWLRPRGEPSHGLHAASRGCGVLTQGPLPPNTRR